MYKRAFARFFPKIGATECPFECGGGGGAQWLFGQCPNELLYFLSGASLTMAGAEFAPSSDLRLSRYLEFFLTSITDIVRLLSHWPKCLFEENKGLKGLFFHSKAQKS